MSLVCVCVLLDFSFLFYAVILHTCQDFELAVFKPFFIKIFKVFFEMPISIVFGGLTPIDWASQHFLQSFNFKSFASF